MSVKPDPDASPEDGERLNNMFTTVWVKVENDTEPETEPVLTPPIVPVCEVNPCSPKPKPKRKNKPPTKILKCDVCDYTTVYKNCLKIHTTSHYNSKPYVCEHCSYTTKYPSSLLRHIAIQHSDVVQNPMLNGKQLTLFQCNQCDYNTYFKWNLKAHGRKHKPEKQYKCEHCPYATCYRHNFKKHCRTHTRIINRTIKKEVFKCDKCPFITKFEGHIQRHLAKIHNEISDLANLCDVCDFSTKEKWRLNKHKQRSKQEFPLKCSYCEFETYYMCQSKKHKEIHFAEIKKATSCKKMFEEIDTTLLVPQISTMEENNTTAANDPYNQLNRSQINENETENNFEANHIDENEAQNDVELNQVNENDAENNFDLNQTENVSDETFQTGENEQNDDSSKNYILDPNCLDWKSIQVQESEDKERPFQCIMCSYTSKFKACVQRHFQRHHTDSKNRPYKCVHCDFSTKTRDQITLHIKRSISDKPLQCTICKFVTKFKCQSILHQKIHYSFACTICGYKCRSKYDLTRHFSITHLDNVLKCQYCDFTTGRKDSLLSHETVHTGDKPYKCDLCEYMSVRQSLLDQHKRRFHSESQERKIVSHTKIQSLKIPIADMGEKSDFLSLGSIETLNKCDT